MTRRVLVIGALGMLGRELFSQLRAAPSISAVGSFNSVAPPSGQRYVKLNSGESEERLRAILGEFDVVINCAVKGTSFLRDASAQKIQDVLEVNSVFPKRITAAAEDTGTRVIHISSDGVFSGREGAPYTEDSIPDPDDLYGMSKFLGEVFSPRVVNIRTSIVGRDPTYQRGILEWFLSKAEGERVDGYVDHLWQGVTTKQLSHAIMRLVVTDAFDGVREEGPIHHFCPNPARSKYELLCLFSKVFSRRVDIQPATSGGQGVDRRMRTKYTRLLNCYQDWASLEETLV